MDYKQIIPNQEMRLKILGLTNFIPDKTMVRLQYRIATGRKLNLMNPRRFTEKLQWYKLYYRDPIMTQCADKYEVRKYVKSKGYGDILVPLYGVYENVEDIDLNSLPDKFVLKTTNGSHTNIFCEDKTKLNIEFIRKQLNNWMFKRNIKAGREWAYYNIKPRVICEKYLEKDQNNDLIDYKFFCFNGKPYCLYVITNRYMESGMKLGIHDINFNQLPYRRSDIQMLDERLTKPKNFELMVEIATDLSKEFPHVRVDLYNIDGKIFFGEMTFYDGSGYKGFIPDEFDFILGDQFVLPG